MRFLDFEKQVEVLDNKINELKAISGGSTNLTPEINKLEEKSNKLLKKIYSNLTPWQKVEIARHEERPQFLDYLEKFSNVEVFSGDRLFGEDAAIICGFGFLNQIPVCFIGQQKGNDTASRIKHNFGMAKPEGYRKASRIMKLANKFSLPIVTFVNTYGAYPGIESEERGQSNAIAQCIKTSFEIEVPIVSVIIGEGGSGGAIAIATADKILMLEHSFYSVISPEGAASILWKDPTLNDKAAVAQKLTANDLFELRIIDVIINEPIGGAHRGKEKVISETIELIIKEVNLLSKIDPEKIKENRIEKYKNIQKFNGLI